MSEPTKAPGLIYELLPKVADEIGAIAKNRRQQQQNYNFRGIDDVYNAVHGPLCKNGVFVTTEVTDVTREERQTKAGGVMIYTHLLMEVTFWAKDGSSVSTVTAGEAMDTSDKSTNKAMSAALKYAMFQTFTIPLEEAEVEDDHHEPTPREAASQPTARPAAAPERQTTMSPRRKCPECEQMQVIPSRFGPGDYCLGCKAKFPDGLPATANA
jgi:hypothetical protein